MQTKNEGLKKTIGEKYFHKKIQKIRNEFYEYSKQQEFGSNKWKTLFNNHCVCLLIINEEFHKTIKGDK